MFNSCTKKYTDESDEKSFQFTFYCDYCGSSHQVGAIDFIETYDVSSHVEKSLWGLKWLKGHAQAFERANYEAKYYFFCCPGCGDYVCANCVSSEVLSSGDIKDLCLNCRNKHVMKRGDSIRFFRKKEKLNNAR